jgi:hypothetical protein
MKMRSKHGGQSVANERAWEFLCDALAKLGDKRVMALGEAKRRKDGGDVGFCVGQNRKKWQLMVLEIKDVCG